MLDWFVVPLIIPLIVPALILTVFILVTLPEAIRRKRQWGSYYSIRHCVRCGEPNSRRLPLANRQRRATIWGCPRCGLETDWYGVPIVGWRPPAPWVVLPADEEAVLPDPDRISTPAKNDRIRVKNGIHRGRP
jgi:hypothetical protein